MAEAQATTHPFLYAPPLKAQKQPELPSLASSGPGAAQLAALELLGAFQVARTVAIKVLPSIVLQRRV